MAQGFRPYTTSRQVRSRRLKMIMLTLIVVIVGLVILIKSRASNEPPQTDPTELPRVSLNDVLPPSRQAAPQPTSTPAPAPAPTLPQDPAPVTAPIATEPASQPAAVESQTPAPTESIAASQTPAAVEAVQEETVQEPADKTSLEAKSLIEKALTLRDSGKIIAARDMLNQALGMQLSPEIRTGVKVQMAKLSEKWLFSRDVLEGDKLTAYFLVQPGGALVKIGREHKVPYEILLRINGIARPELLQAGRRIKVINGPFHAVVNRTAFTLDLYLQDMYVKTYRVGLGRSEHTTPTGRWVVASGGKMISPTWTDPDTGRTYKGSDPDYPLGSRWIALEGIEGDARGRTGFALHGTKDPESIGTQSSRGCIRLYNGDVIEVYELLEPDFSNVQVTD